MEISKIFSIGLISLLGAISPGPDFAIVTRNCITGTFRTGVLTSLGVAVALSIHVTYCLLGIAIVIQQSPLMFNIIKIIGAAYLFYLGIMLLKEKKKTSPEGSPKIAEKEIKRKHKAFLSGFLCNLLNPKCTLYVLSVFSQFIDPSMSILDKVIIGIVFPIVGFIWFTFLSFLITHHLLQKHFARFQFIITKGMGIVLCLLALYIAFLS